MNFMNIITKIVLLEKRTLKLTHLAQTGGVKDFNYISASIFWRDGAIVEWYKQEVPLKNIPKGKGQKIEHIVFLLTTSVWFTFLIKLHQ